MPKTLKLLAALVVGGILAVCAAPSILPAQQPWQFARTTGITPAMDTAVVVSSDSLHVTKGMTWAQARKLISARQMDSVLSAGLMKLAANQRFVFAGTDTIVGSPTFFATDTLKGTLFIRDSVKGQPTWLSTQTFATGQRVDSATGAARATILTRAADSARVAVSGFIVTGGTLASGRDSISANTALVFAGTDTVKGQPAWATNLQHLTADTATLAKNLTGSPAITVSSCSGCSSPQDSIRLKNGAAATPSLMFANSLTTGVYRFGADTIGVAIAGANAFQIPSIGKLVGPAGNSTIVSGTGASRQLALQTTTSGSAATTALRFNELQQSLAADGAAATPGLGFAADSLLGFFRHGTAGANDTLAIATNGVNSLNIRGGAAVTLLGGAGNMTIQAGTGNSRKLVLQTTTSGGTATTFVRGNELQQALFPDSTTTALPSISFATDSTMGFRRITGSNMFGAYIAGNRQHVFAQNVDTTFGTQVVTGSAITGGTNSMTILAGSGNNRRMTLQTTTSGGAATTFLRANELQQSLFADGAVGTPGIGFAADTILGLYRIGTAGASDTLMVAANGVVQMKIAPAGILRLPALPSEGSTKNAVCFDGTTFNVTQNAAATCTVSSIRYKKDTLPVPVATTASIISNLHANQYTEKEGGRKAFGIIAELADKVDPRLASRDSKGVINSTNYEEVTSLLVDRVNQQQVEIGSLSKQLASQKGEIDELRAAVAALMTAKPIDPGSIMILRPTYPTPMPPDKFVFDTTRRTGSMTLTYPPPGMSWLPPADSQTTSFVNAGKLIFTITPTGKFILGPGATPDSAAKAIMDAVNKGRASAIPRRDSLPH